MKKPKCKCGRICDWYGPIGGYSVACKQCNKKNAARQRVARHTNAKAEIDYLAVLEELKKRRDLLDAAIAALKSL